MDLRGHAAAIGQTVIQRYPKSARISAKLAEPASDDIITDLNGRRREEGGRKEGGGRMEEGGRKKGGGRREVEGGTEEEKGRRKKGGARRKV